MLRKAGAVWSRIREPRRVKAEFFTIYMVATAVGLVTLAMPPTSIQGVLGVLLTYVWSGALTLGGMLGTAAVFPGWWWLERLGVLSILVGILIYFTVVMSLHFTESGNRLTQAGFILLASTVFILRWQGIWRYTFEPRG